MEGSKRVCGKCRLEKSLEDFPRDRNEKLGRRYWCKPCSQESNKIYKRNNPAKTSAWHKKWNDSHPESQKVWQGHKSRSEYFQQLEAQGGVCAICGNPETRRSTAGNLCQLPWDHNHTTGTFR